MHVVHAALEIVLVARGVLPISPLPNATLAVLDARWTLRHFLSTLMQVTSREFLFDPSPTQRIFAVAGRQSPNRVQMIRQQHERHDLKRPFCADFLKCRTKAVSR